VQRQEGNVVGEGEHHYKRRGGGWDRGLWPGNREKELHLKCKLKISNKNKNKKERCALQHPVPILV